MKILWVSHLLPFPPIGGVSQRSYNLIKEMAKKNELHLIAFNQKAYLNSKSEIEYAKKEFQKFCKSVQVFDIPSDTSNLKWYVLLITSFFKKTPYSVNWITSKKFEEAIEQFVKSNEIDVIHVDTIGLNENIKRFKLHPNVLKVLNHHNVESHMMDRRWKKEKNILKKIYFWSEAIKLKKYEQKYCQEYDLNLVVSELDKERLLESFPGLEVMEVPNGVDVDYFKSKKMNEVSHSLIFAASLDWYPNNDGIIWFLINVWPGLKNKDQEVRLTVAGRNPSKELKKIAITDPAIELTGFVKDIRPYFDRAEIYVCPIRDGGGTKLKLLDAMAMNKPIVSTVIGSEGLEFENGDDLLLVETPEEFIDKILLLFEDKLLRKKLGANARKLVINKYSWTRIGENLQSIYNNNIMSLRDL